MPEGKLVCVHDRKKYVKWFQSDGHKSVYISKDNRKLAEKLAYKKYLQRKQKCLSARLAMLQTIASDYERADQAYLRMLEDPAYQDLLKNYDVCFGSMEEESRLWMEEPFETNTNHPEHLVHPTVNGLFVRSKSESLIAICLAQHGIAFRYECRLELGNIVAYPDFTIRKAKSGRLVYWEHFGMMNNAAYADDAMRKLHTYVNNGYLPGVDLITTYEDSQHPLTYERIENIIQSYLE